MGKRGGWFSAVRRALYFDPKEEKDQKLHKSKRKWFGKTAKAASDAVPMPVEAEPLSVVVPSLPPQQPLPPPPPPLETLKLAHVEDEQSKRAFSVALATAVAAVAVAQAAAEVVRLTSATLPGEFPKRRLPPSGSKLHFEDTWRGGGYDLCEGL